MVQKQHGSGRHWLRNIVILLVSGYAFHLACKKPNKQDAHSSQTVIKFYHKGQPGYEFTNFYTLKTPLLIDGKLWKTSEHYFQAMKFPHNKGLQDEIGLCATPGEAFKLAKENNSQKRDDWETVKEDIMLTALREKFKAGTDLAQVLLDTGNAHLIEDSPVDYYWGIGAYRTGYNRLGVLLMRVRAELQMRASQ